MAFSSFSSGSRGLLIVDCSNAHRFLEPLFFVDTRVRPLLDLKKNRIL
jgi:hypothetical protein